MMTPLQNEQRRRGGAARAENQSESDRRFLAMLAASRRPLKNDVQMTEDQLLRELRELSKAGPGGGRKWLYFGIVGADGRTIRAELDDKTVLHRLKLVGGAIGYMGVTMFGTPQKGSRTPSIQTYYKPLKKGTAVIEKLDKVSRTLIAAVIASIKPVDVPLSTEAGE